MLLGNGARRSFAVKFCCHLVRNILYLHFHMVKIGKNASIVTVNTHRATMLAAPIMAYDKISRIFLYVYLVQGGAL
jgi:hypothetical protein